MSAPNIPATALGGDLLTGWCGPHLVPFYRGAGSPPEWVSKPYAGSPVWSDGGDERRLDPRRAEVAHRVADVLRAKGHEVGHLLPVALGGRQSDVIAEVPCEICGGDGYHKGPRLGDEPCPDCGGSGTIRRTIPAADVSAVLLAASVAGVEAGRGVVRGVLGGWTNDHGYWVRALPATRHIGMEGVTVNDSGWRVPTARIDPYWTSYGPETGPEGRAAADAALLRLGYAYLDPAAPFGVVVPFLRDGREVQNV